jgi:hypothetical protein
VADDQHDELTELRAIRARMGTDGPEGFETLEAFETPPEGIWDRIAAEVADDAATTGSPVVPLPDSLEPEGAKVYSMPRRVPPAVWAVGAAAAVVIAIFGLVAAIGGGNDADLVASSVLERLQGETAEGTADLVDEDGSLRLQLDTSGLDEDGDTFLEVWMIDPTVSELVSLGPLRSDGTYDLPPGMDAAAFPIVDVSIEPLNGDPTHSGNSILRGQLQF